MILRDILRAIFGTRTPKALAPAAPPPVQITARAIASQPAPARSATLADTIAAVAETQVGVRESGNNEGAKLREYWTATNIGDGTKLHYAWCAAFICWCIMTAIARMGIAAPWARPRTARAFDFELWAKDLKSPRVTLLPPSAPIKRGDIITYTFSHVEIAVRDTPAGVSPLCVGGNTNDAGAREGQGVFKRERSRSLIRSVIRLS